MLYIYMRAISATKVILSGYQMIFTPLRPISASFSLGWPINPPPPHPQQGPSWKFALPPFNGTVAVKIIM